ncbi:MAG: winged helix-turn-helix domain-containing protein [Tannerella sp.]|jgi:protease II|nr:winged helix-turn-helix domain-containing protein [Tannerella sp.]
MTNEIIGTNAGLVWNTLSGAGELSIKELKKKTKIRTDKVLFAALGWLAKEDKLIFNEKEDDLFVSLA